MKSISALLLALVAWTGSLGAVAQPRCAMAAARCAVRPCCAPKKAHGPSLRPRLACCEVASSSAPSPTPGTTPDFALRVGLPSVVATLAPRAELLVAFVPALTPRPRGPPLYLRNRSLLL